MKRHAEALAKIVGRAHVRAKGSLVSPASQAEVAALLRRCRELGARVALARRQDERRVRNAVTLDLARLDGVIGVDATSRVVEAGAGVTLRQLERELRACGLTAGPLAQRDPDATLGSLMQHPRATDRSPRYGRFVDLCIGLEAVRPDGTRVHWRAAPRKAAGPDWRALVFGGGWTAAVVTSLSLRVFGVPETRRTIAFSFPGRRVALDAARQAVLKEVRPASWWCDRVLSAELEGPEAIVKVEARALEGAARAARGRSVAASARPRGKASHESWGAVWSGRGPVSEMTLDGGCLHGRARTAPRPGTGLARALDPDGVLIWRGS